MPKTSTEEFIDNNVLDFEGSPCNECEHQRQPYDFDECANCTMESVKERPSNYRVNDE